jgi:hypothetical protein
MEKINLKYLSLSDLITLKNYLSWCESNMEDTCDDFDERTMFREEFNIKRDAITTEIHSKIDNIDFTNNINQTKNPIARLSATNIMKQFRKKPVVISASQIINNEFRSIDDIPFSDCKDWKLGSDEQGFYISIPTLEGDMKARNNDWIIQGVNKEYYPCKPDIFEKTYEKVE